LSYKNNKKTEISSGKERENGIKNFLYEIHFIFYPLVIREKKTSVFTEVPFALKLV